MNRNPMQKYWLFAAIALCSLVLNACTPVQTEAVTPCTGTGCPVAIGSVDLLVSSQQLPSDGKTPVTLTARVLSTANAAVADQAVTFAADSGSLIVQTTTTDTNGIATATITPGTDKSNRTITVSATVNGVTKTNTIQVTGTNITTTGVNAVTINTPITVKATVRDSSGTAIPNSAFTATGSAGTISVTPSSGTSDGSGEYTVTATPSASGSFTINFAALGATVSHSLTVDGDTFGVDASSPLKNNSSLLVNTDGTVTVAWSKNGIAQANKTLTFASTRGTFNGAPGAGGSISVTTDSNGKASATLKSASTGIAAITISGPGGAPSTTIQITYITNQASKIEIQPAITSIAANSNGSSTNKISLPALVRDSNNNLVKDANVQFSITSDPSGGALSAPGFATTDISGVATVDYIAGTNTSGQNGVIITATVSSIAGNPITPISKSINLTVGGQGLFIRVNTDNVVQTISAGKYTKSYYALVTDAGGAAVKDATISFVLKPLQYFKGTHAWSAGSKSWVQVISKTCQNEDINFNGTLDSGEDLNNSGDVTPGNIASVTNTAITDASGFATADITYVKGYAQWGEFQLIATAKVAGTEALHTATLVLPGAATDYGAETVAPPGYNSPFGVSSVCTDAN